jgi:type IV secretion system protein VirD4
MRSVGRRTLAKAAAAVLAVASLTAGVCYLSGVLFLVASRANPGQAQVFSIFSYWRLYAGEPSLDKRLRTSSAIAALLAFLIVPAVLASALTRRRSLHGDARFASALEVRRSGLLAGGGGILLGRWGGSYLSLEGPEFLMLCAPTRSGKGVSIVIPNLLNWPQSVVTVDIKRENFEITAGYRARHGQRVHLFSPFDEQGRSARFNPLSYVRPDAAFRVGDILAIATILYPLEMRTAGSSDAFFNDQARNLFLGLALLLVESTELARTIGEMLRQASGKRKTIKDHLTEVVGTRQREGRPLSDQCVDALMRFMANSENTLASILASFNAPLTIFADPLVDAATSGDDFLLTDLRKKPISIYVHVPPNRLAQGALLVNLFFSLLLDQNTRELPSQNPALRYSCLLLLDEFPALGRIVVLEKGVGFIAGYGLRLVTITQSNAMLSAIYGREIARNLATNHMARIFFAPQELEDAQEYSETLGYQTERRESRSVSYVAGRGRSSSVNRSEEKRALMLPQELREMDADKQIVILQGVRPILTKKICYYEDPNFIGRLLAPPPVPPIDTSLYQARVDARTREVRPEDLAQGVDLERLAHGFDDLPPIGDNPSDEEVARQAQHFLDRLCLMHKGEMGAIADADEDGSEDADGEGGRHVSIDRGAVEGVIER